MTPVLDNAISVSPEKIKQTAQLASRICERLIYSMEGVEQNVAESATAWQSDSAELFREFFRENRQDFEEVKNGLQKKIMQLNEIAALYDRTEADAGQAASTLPDAILS